jgi:gamma-glutamyltranspeptidase/glutathione hydrolase
MQLHLESGYACGISESIRKWVLRRLFQIGGTDLRGMVVAPQPLAVEEGILVLGKGGNAIDAAVTAAFVQGVIDPLSCGIGGFGVMLVHKAQGEDLFLDFNATAGSIATPDMWINAIEGPATGDAGYLLKGNVNEIGYQSVGVPGTVIGLHRAWEMYGTLGWEEVLRPAIHHARKGYTIPVELAHKWRKTGVGGRSGSLARFTCTPATADIYTKDGGQLLEAGDVLRNSDLARTLEMIAQKGPQEFYQGELAERIAQDMATHGGLITKKDLESYDVVATKPLVGSYRGYTVATSPAPCGGITVLEILNILEGYDLAEIGFNTTDYVHIVSQAMKASFADRNRFVGDPLFAAVPEEWLMSKARARQWRDRIDRREQFRVDQGLSKETPDTTHISVVDHDGNCVSLTHTLGICSGVVTAGLGFLYNECMRLFDPMPGGPNGIAPGKRRVTGMAPTILYKDDKPVMVLGAPGGNRIMGAVLQTILNVVDHGMTALDAVSAPRIDCQGETIDVEGRIPRWVCQGLRKMGHEVDRDLASYGSFPARVHAILIDQHHGTLHGGADPRDYGMALSVASPGRERA